MAKILEFKAPVAKPKKTGKSTGKKTKQRPGNALCREGHHKWVVDKSTDFAVKKGKLLTLYRCMHCGITKTKAE